MSKPTISTDRPHEPRQGFKSELESRLIHTWNDLASSAGGDVNQRRWMFRVALLAAVAAVIAGGVGAISSRSGDQPADKPVAATATDEPAATTIDDIAGAGALDLRQAALFSHAPGEFPGTKTVYDLEQRLGYADHDSGWLDTTDPGAADAGPQLCTGAQVRVIAWAGMILRFERPPASVYELSGSAAILSETLTGWLVMEGSTVSRLDGDTRMVPLSSDEGVAVGSHRADVEALAPPLTATQDGLSTVVNGSVLRIDLDDTGSVQSIAADALSCPFE